MVKTRHDGDCYVYMADPRHPLSGICTCGYGMDLLRDEADDSELVNQELWVSFTELQEENAKLRKLAAKGGA